MTIPELKELLTKASDPAIKIRFWKEIGLPSINDNEAIFLPLDTITPAIIGDAPIQAICTPSFWSESRPKCSKVGIFSVKIKDVNLVVTILDDGKISLGVIQDPSTPWIKLAKLVREKRTTTVNGFVRAFQSFLQEVLEKEGRK